MAYGDEFEISVIREEQARLRAELERLERRIALLPVPEKRAPAGPPPLPAEPIARVIEKPADGGLSESLREAKAAVAPSVERPPLPPSLPVESAAAPTDPPADPADPAAPPEPPAARNPFELEFGAVWLARIGIVVLLTGLVFLGNYARQIIVPHLGPGAKLALLYGLSGVLAGAGARLRTRWQGLKLYSQVLSAGGGALAYYCTYAAHFVSALRVIESPLVGGALLLACGGLLLFIAERRRWEIAALLTILLSYYTAGINPIGDFTLFSNLLLTGAGVFLLFRHRWVRLSWVSLFGTYGSFAYWHFFRDVATTGLRAEEPWTLGLAFLASYWVLFTAAVFFSGRDAFRPFPRVAFLSLNNAAVLFYATVQWLAKSGQGDLWVLYAVFGGLLLALAAAAFWRRPEEPEVDGAYLVQGVALVTCAFGLKLSGLPLALTCTVESLILLSGVGRRHGTIFLVLGIITAFLGFGEASDHIAGSTLVVAVLLLADAWWLKFRRGIWPALKISPAATYFAALGLILASRRLWDVVPPLWQPDALAVAAVVCAASVYLIRLPELVYLGQSMLGIAIMAWLGRHADFAGQVHPLDGPWWQPLPLALCALGFGHWWQKQRLMPVEKFSNQGLQFVSALFLIGPLLAWMHLIFRGDAWLAALCLGALVSLFYGWLTRAWAIVLCGQAFIFTAVVWLLANRTLHTFPLTWKVALFPAIVLIVSSQFLPRAAGPAAALFAPRGEPTGFEPPFYWPAGLAILALWVHDYLPVPWHSFTYAILTVALLALAGFARHRPSGFGSFLFVGLTFVSFFLALAHPPAIQELVALALVAAATQLASRHAGGKIPALRYVVPTIIGLTSAGLWLWITQWCNWNHHERSLTAAWSACALLVLGVGLALQERVYRLAGFAILALALGRIFIVDIPALEPLYRILSCLTLGVVLLVIGYIYSRYADKIRKWL